MTTKYDIYTSILKPVMQTPCIAPGGGATQQSSIQGGSAPRSNLKLPYEIS